MKRLKYIPGVVTLGLDVETCIGCGQCLEVCPHAVFEEHGKKVKIKDRDYCIECGACAKNCPVEAITVDAGVGCAAAVIYGKLMGTEPDCGELCCGPIGSGEEDKPGAGADGPDSCGCGN